MKKNFFKKKLASGLALALVVASLAPAVPASAATATKVVKQGGATAPTTLFVGNKVDYSLSKIYSSNSYTWTSSDKSVATVSAKYGVVTPVAPGKVTLTCTARNAEGKWLNAFKVTLNVKLRATSVDAGTEDFDLFVGENKDLNAVKSPSNSTDSIRYYSDNTAVATVNAKTGVVTAVGAGEATITVYSKSAWNVATASKYNRTDAVDVTVVDGIIKAEQTESKELDLTFSFDTKDIKTTDIAIVNETTKQAFPVKEVEDDGKVLTVETFSDMTDGKVYSVTYDDKTVQFTATDDVVASLAISPITIAFDTEETISVSTVDKNGVVLDEYDYDAVEDSKLDFDIETTEGYTTGSDLVLFEKGNTAKATATYHTYEYDNNGNEVGAVKTSVTIVAVDKTAVTVNEVKYTVDDSFVSDWDDVTVNTKLAIEDEINNKLSVYIEKSDDEDVDVSEDYTFESSNTDVLLVADNGVADGAAVLTAVAQGTAYVLVKDSDDDVVYSFPISIVSEREATSLVLDKTSVTLSNSDLADDQKTIKVTVKDQYGAEIKDANDAGDIEVECLSTPDSDITKASVEGLAFVDLTQDGEVTFIGEAYSTEEHEGTYTYSITVDDLTKIVKVVIVAPDTDDTTATYKLDLSDSSIDMNFDGDSDENMDVVIKVASIKGAAVEKYATIDDFEIKNADGDVVTGGAIATINDTTSITFTALAIDGSDNVTKADTGKYTFKVDVLNENTLVADDTITLSGSFTITDTQAGVTVTREEEVVSSLDIVTAVDEAFDFYYAGDELEDGEYTISDVETTPDVDVFEDGKSYFIKKVTVNVVVSGDEGDFQVPVTITVGKSITIDN